MRVEGRKVTDIEILIRKDKCLSGWDGIGHIDKQFKSISIRVAEILKRVEAEDGINLGQLESMPHSKAIFSQKKVFINFYNTSS